MVVASTRYFGAECATRWHCLIVRRQSASHDAARQFMRDAGAFAFYPSQIHHRKVKVGPPRPFETPIIPGYVFAQFRAEPQWHLWRRKRWFLDVFKVGENPYSFSYAQIKHLQELDASLAAMDRAKANARTAAAIATRPVAGQQAEFIAGAFIGQTVTITAIEGVEAVFDLMGIKVRAKLDGLRRLA